MTQEDTKNMSCRPDHLFSVWMIEPTKFDQMVELALTLDPTMLKKEAEEKKTEDKPGYTVDSDGLAKLQIQGPITKYPSSYNSVFGGAASVVKQKALRDMAKDDRVKAIAMVMDSPGGTVLGTPEVGDEIMKIRQKKPVYAVIEGDACSGAYWWASQADYIFANPVAHIGSIGSTIRLYDYSKQMEREGIVAVPIDSGKFKSLGMRGKQITEEDKADILRIVNGSKDLLFSAITANRNVSTEALQEMQARIYVGEEAKGKGLVDEICHVDDALDKIRQSLSSGAGGRLLGNLREAARSIADDPARSYSMGAFTPKQIEALRTAIPSAAAITDEKLPESVASHVVEQAATVTQLKSKNEQLEAKVSELKGQAVEKIDPKVAAGHISVFQREVSLMVKEGKLLPTQAQILNDTVMVNEKPNVSLVMSNGAIMIPASAMSKIVELNKPTGLTGELTQGQVTDRLVPETENNQQVSGQTDAQRQALNDRVAKHMGVNKKKKA